MAKDGELGLVVLEKARGFLLSPHTRQRTRPERGRLAPHRSCATHNTKQLPRARRRALGDSHVAFASNCVTLTFRTAAGSHQEKKKKKHSKTSNNNNSRRSRPVRFAGGALRRCVASLQAL